MQPIQPNAGVARQHTALADDAHAQIIYHVLAAEMAMHGGQRNLAAQEYAAALQYSDDPALAKRAVGAALIANNRKLAQQAAEIWSQAAPDSLAVQKTAARLALRSGRLDALAAHAARILQNDPDGIDSGFITLVSVLTGDPKHAADALAVMKAQVATHADLAAAQYALGLLAFHYKHMALAGKAVRKALAQHPQWPKAVLLRARMLVASSHAQQAGRLINDLAGSAAERAGYQLAYARMLLRASQTGAAKDAFRRALALQPDNAAAQYGYGVLLLSQRNFEQARDAFKSLYAAGKLRDDAAYYLGGIAAQRGDYAKAQTWFGRVDGGAYAARAQLETARMQYKQGNLDAARNTLALVRQQYPRLRDDAYAVEGALLYGSGAYQKALDLYAEALSFSPDNVDLRYGRALVYERMGQVDKAEAQLRLILQENPDNARTLNALGYMLANHSQHYQQALVYVRRALQQEPDNPAMIDSLGWVQYRLGHLHKARTLLQQAYAKMPDPEVAAHLGEVLWQLGEHDEASSVWARAQSRHPHNRVLHETIHRLNP